MKYIAKKPCSFSGSKYFIGDEIPAEQILDPIAQKMMGVIEVVEGDSKSSIADPEEGGPLLPPSPTLEEPEEKKAYTKHQLDRKTKDELLDIAEELGVEASEDTKKAELIALIIEAQEV